MSCCRCDPARTKEMEEKKLPHVDGGELLVLRNCWDDTLIRYCPWCGADQVEALYHDRLRELFEEMFDEWSFMGEKTFFFYLGEIFELLDMDKTETIKRLDNSISSIELLPLLDPYSESDKNDLCRTLINDTLIKFKLDQGSYESIRKEELDNEQNLSALFKASE